MTSMNSRIKKLRTMLGLNQTDFGKKLGVSRSVILNIELDKVAPKELMLDHICDIFNVNENWLLTGNGEVFINEEIKTKKSPTEFDNLFKELSPEFQEHILDQIKALIKIQKK